jgi:hypothetical protein
MKLIVILIDLLLLYLFLDLHILYTTVFQDTYNAYPFSYKETQVLYIQRIKYIYFNRIHFWNTYIQVHTFHKMVKIFVICTYIVYIQ